MYILKYYLDGIGSREMKIRERVTIVSIYYNSIPPQMPDPM